jgi:hypothetical protein
MDYENVVYVHNGVLFSHKKYIMLFVGQWMEMEDIMLSAVSQVQEDKGPVFSLICRR